ncbi:MAG: hypothetical protein ACAI34_07455 [Verrucomicrobium sp.]|nr:hypothetical protein [Verrucomicrobium sp.]
MKIVPKLSRPCSQDWNAMTGDDKCRYCEGCQLHVHNIDALSPAEKRALFATPGERRCITYSVTADTLSVRTGTWQMLQQLLRPWRAVAAALALFLPGAFTLGATPPTDVPSHAAPSAMDAKASRDVNASSGKRLAGVPCPSRPPLWRRIFFFWQKY